MNRDSRRLSTTDFIYEKLKENIVELIYKPEKALVETTLAKEFGVSRTPLRQALHRLEFEGLLVKQPNGRLSVSPMSIQEAKEIFAVREVLEGLIAREACVHIAKSNNFKAIIQRIEDVTYLMRKAAEENRRQDIVIYGSDFHSLLEENSNNATAVNMLNQINNHVMRYRRLGAYKDPKYPSILPVEEHEYILEQLKAKDDLAVEAAMRQHIKRSLKNTIAAISFISEIQ